MTDYFEPECDVCDDTGLDGDQWDGSSWPCGCPAGARWTPPGMDHMGRIDIEFASPELKRRSNRIGVKMNARDLSMMPTAKTTQAAVEGQWQQEKEPRYAHLVAQRWADEDEYKPSGRRLRFSNAGKCSRAMSYHAMGIEPSDPMDLTGQWATGLGRIIHDLVQTEMREYVHGDNPVVSIQIEPETTLDELGGMKVVKGFIDGVSEEIPNTDDDEPTNLIEVVEAKSIGGYGFKLAVGAFKSDWPGPKFDHILQGGLYGRAVGADRVRIVYISKEAISKTAAKSWMTDIDRFVAEWVIPMEELDDLVDREIARMNAVVALADEDIAAKRAFPTPELPPGAEINNPKRGSWTVIEDGKITNASTRAWWACNYCDWQTLCAETPSGRISRTDIEAAEQRVKINTAAGGADV